MRSPRTLLPWAAQIVFAKRTVSRTTPGFALDLAAYDEAHLQEHVPALREVERRLLEVPPDRHGMRWIHEGEVVLFHAERTFDHPYESFVSRVDIGHVAQFYRDALGVTTTVVDRDGEGRSRLQGVHVIALPQPNYAAFLGKEELDVYKLELLERSDDAQRAWILNVHSPNGSALCDDGAMTFARAADGSGTVVSFFACQNFPNPPLMRVTRLDRWRWFMTLVTESAYRRFGTSMWRNVEDCYHGRDFAIGRPAPALAGRLA